MLKALLLCAAACAAPTTVMAGDKDLSIVPNLHALLASDGAARVPPGRKTASQPATFMPIAYRGLERVGPLPAGPVEPVPVAAPLSASFTLAEPRALPSWHIGAIETESQSTRARGGSWAVYDTLSDHRKPRFRRSMMSTMLVLRIDGQEDSAPLSVGGGGVAAALWRVVPGE